MLRCLRDHGVTRMREFCPDPGFSSDDSVCDGDIFPWVEYKEKAQRS